MPTLYLMFGYPGAGKTTVAKIIEQLTGATHLSSDEERVRLFSRPDFSQTEHEKLYDTLDRETESLLADGKDVFLSMSPALLYVFQRDVSGHFGCERANGSGDFLLIG